MADLAAAEQRSDWTPAWGARLLDAAGKAFAAEGERRLLWLPVFFGAGIGVYFVLRVEPPLWPGIVAAMAGAGLAYTLRRRPGWCEAAVALTVFAAGFALMREAAWEREPSMLQRRLGPVTVTGRVVDVDRLERGWRLVIAPDPLPGFEAGPQPRRLRLHIPRTSDVLDPGDRVRLKAMLYPPSGPTLPGGYDFQRAAYFAGLDGVGYSYGGARRVSGPAEVGSADADWGEDLRRLRVGMERRITAALPGSTGGIASALITGKRGAISEEVTQAFRDSGLAHLLSVSGDHLGLVGGIVFFAVRALLALVPWVALRMPIKKIAAGAALLAVAFYLMICGAAVSTQRAFIMTGLVFGAILVDRMRISMRVCAIAAFALLAIDPASLISVSFQMSFGAVIALIAVYETFGGRIAALMHGRPLSGRVLGYCGAVLLTTVVATIGTDPFSIYHFHRWILYSPLANVLAVPLTAVWVVPWAVVTCALMPFGLEKLGLVPMGWGIDVVIWIARQVSALPGNVWAVPRLPIAGLMLIVLGGLWLCLWRGRWRRWGLIGVAAGAAGMMLTRPPDVVIADGGRFLAARAADGHYFVAAGRSQKIMRSRLGQETGEEQAPWPAAREAAADGLDCAGELCRYSARGKRVAIVSGSGALPVDCGAFDAIVAQVPAGFRCRSTIPVVDRIDSWRRGAVALWLDADGIEVVSANESRGDRPWVPRPHPRKPRGESR